MIECNSTLYVGVTQKKNGGLYRTYITFLLKYLYGIQYKPEERMFETTEGLPCQ